MLKLRLFPLFLSVLALLAAMWAGLVRIGWPWPALQPTLPAAHGPLMISGFLGTLIAVERAVAFGKRWAYAAPMSSALGGLLLLSGLSWIWGHRLLTLGSLGLAITFAFMVRRHLALHAAVMAVGAITWFIGNVLHGSGWGFHRVVPWWMAFLVLTIAGERLELSRVLRHTRSVQLRFLAILLVYGAGIILSTVSYAWGMRFAGLGLVLLAAWLLSYDIARHNIRHTGLTQFIAICLFSGYVWLGIGGVLAIIYGGIAAGPLYDATLHAVFLGFVFAMIFGHAPIIFPSVLQRPIQFSPAFYTHLVLLHLSLSLRILGDLLNWQVGRQWGGMLNVAVLLLFLGNTVAGVIRARSQSEPLRV